MSPKALIPSTTTVTSRDPKGIKLTDLFAAILNKAKLDDGQAQRVIEHTEFPVDVLAILRKYATPNEYANEEVPSSYGYLSGYRVPKPIAEQMRILRQHFSKHGDADELVATQPLPAGAEGYFAIPRWQSIAATYGEAVEKVLDALKKARRGKLENYRKGQLGPGRPRETNRKRLAFQKLGDAQPGHDILVVAAQFGLRHRGRSVRRAWAVMLSNEFGIGAFEGLIMVLTHVERLQHSDDLWLYFAGDEYFSDAHGRFEYCPGASFGGGRLKLDFSRVDDVHGYCGSVSAFVPQ